MMRLRRISAQGIGPCVIQNRCLLCIEDVTAFGGAFRSALQPGRERISVTGTGSPTAPVNQSLKVKALFATWSI
jgi:hypothetical protein